MAKFSSDKTNDGKSKLLQSKNSCQNEE